MLKVMCEFSDYKPWCGAVETYERIQKEDKLDDLEMLLEECYPEGITMTQINDILWFDSEWVYEQLGMSQEEEEEEEEEKEEEEEE